MCHMSSLLAYRTNCNPLQPPWPLMMPLISCLSTRERARRYQTLEHRIFGCPFPSNTAQKGLPKTYRALEIRRLPLPHPHCAARCIACVRAHCGPVIMHLFSRSVIASGRISRFAPTFVASFSSIPLKGSYTAITEQLWRQREQAKLRVHASTSSADKCVAPMAPKPQHDTVVVYEFPGDPKLRDEYRCPSPPPLNIST